MISVVILAGGLATRLGDITKHTPKSMLMVGKHPFIHHQLTWLYNEGVRDVVICAGYFGEEIEKFVGNGSRYGLNVRFSFDGEKLDGGKLMGTGGSVKKALHLLDDKFFVMYGDSYLNISLSEVLDHFLRSGKSGLMTVYKNDNNFDKSNIEFDGTNIIKYNKTPDISMKHIDYGLEVFSKDSFDKIQLDTFDLSLVINNLIAISQLDAFESKDRFYEIGSEQGLKETDTLLRDKI